MDGPDFRAILHFPKDVDVYTYSLGEMTFEILYDIVYMADGEFRSLPTNYAHSEEVGVPIWGY